MFAKFLSLPLAAAAMVVPVQMFVPEQQVAAAVEAAGQVGIIIIQ
jgi:hypothetical protein